MPNSCLAVSLLTLLVGSQTCERSRILLFCDSFDSRGFMKIIRSFVDCFGERWTSAFQKSVHLLPHSLSIAHATVLETGLSRECLARYRIDRKTLFRFRNPSSRFRVDRSPQTST